MASWECMSGPRSSGLIGGPRRASEGREGSDCDPPRERDRAWDEYDASEDKRRRSEEERLECDAMEFRDVVEEDAVEFG